MTLKEEITEAMTELARDPLVRFVGYGLKTGRAMGTLRGVPAAQIYEFPVAENLMVGAAIGMAMEGLIPVVYFERADFIANAMDAIVNHLDKIERISGGEFKPGVIMRATVGNIDKPLFTGPTHTQPLADGVDLMADSVAVSYIFVPQDVRPEYRQAYKMAKLGASTLLVEYKDML